MNHRHFGFFFITQNCQKQRCWVRVTGAPPALHTQQAGALDTAVMARSAPHNASSVRLHQASSDQRKSTLLHSVATHILSLSPSLPPFVSSFVSRGMEPASEEAEEEEEEEAW